MHHLVRATKGPAAVVYSRCAEAVSDIAVSSRSTVRMLSQGDVGTLFPGGADRASVGLCGSLGFLACEPPAIFDDVFGAGG